MSCKFHAAAGATPGILAFCDAIYLVRGSVGHRRRLPGDLDVGLGFRRLISVSAAAACLAI
jgi:hypothetical protein